MRSHKRSVYAIQAANGWIKVGISSNLARRMKALAYEERTQVTLLAEWKTRNAGAIERAAHRSLRPLFPHRGEWFQAPANDVFSAVEAAMGVDVRATRRPKLPPLPEIPAGIRHRLGYARALSNVPVRTQERWLLLAGIDPRDVFREDDPSRDDAYYDAFRDARAGDAFLIWSREVIETVRPELDIRKTGAVIVSALR